MITEENYLEPPACRKCEGLQCNEKGWYAIRIKTGDEAQEYMTPIGEEIRKQCSWKKAEQSRRKHWMNNPYFENSMKLLEMTDYLPSRKSTPKTTEEHLSGLGKLTNVRNDVESFDGFLLIEGKTNTGKNCFAHILARHFNDAGYYPKLVSIVDLALETSELQRGSKVYDKNDKVIYDIDEWCKADLLVIDHFEMVNEYFRFGDIRRANLVKIFKTRQQGLKPTIVLSSEKIEDVFHSEILKLSKIPNDLPRFINKNLTRVTLHGRFQKPRKNPKIEKEKGSAGIKSFTIKIGKDGIVEQR